MEHHLSCEPPLIPLVKGPGYRGRPRPGMIIFVDERGGARHYGQVLDILGFGPLAGTPIVAFCSGIRHLAAAPPCLELDIGPIMTTTNFLRSGWIGCLSESVNVDLPICDFDKRLAFLDRDGSGRRIDVTGKPVRKPYVLVSSTVSQEGSVARRVLQACGGDMSFYVLKAIERDWGTVDAAALASWLGCHVEFVHEKLNHFISCGFIERREHGDRAALFRRLIDDDILFREC